MKIRKAKIEDSKSFLNMLLNLDKETEYMMYEENERPKDENRVKGIINSSLEENLLLLVEDRDIIGFLSAQRGIQKRVRHSAYIVVGIRDGYRGKGIGTELFKKLDLWAREKSIKRLELSVMCNNEIGKKLYEKIGFKVEGIKRNSMIVNGKYIDEYCMAKLY